MTLSLLISEFSIRHVVAVDFDVDNVERSLTPTLTKVPVADPGVGTRQLKIPCHESMLLMWIMMAMSMNTMSLMNSLSNLFLLNFVELLVELIVLDELLKSSIAFDVPLDTSGKVLFEILTVFLIGSKRSDAS